MRLQRHLASPALLAALSMLAACGGNSSGSALVTVGKTGSGSGTVTSSPAGIDCGSTCSGGFNDGASVTLTATPAAGSKFDGWSGGCAGVGDCTLIAKGALAVSAAFSPASNTPGVPTGVTADAGDSQATIHWVAPADTGGRALTAFVISSGTGPNAISQTAAASATSLVISGLINGTSYTFTVAAQNALSLGSPSAGAVVTPKGKPLSVSGLAGTIGDKQVSLSWTAGNGNGAAVSKYTVTATPGAVVKTTTGTTLVFDGLTNGTAYSFTVYATNSVGDGPQSVAAANLVPSTVPAAPAAPVAVAGVRSATLTWTAPDSGGNAITGYEITQSIGGGAYASATSSITGTSATITGLGDGVSVSFKVAAKNGRGTGAASAGSNTVNTVALPGQVTGVTATRGDTSVTVAWTAPASASPLTKYTLAYTKAGVAAGTLDVADPAATSAVVTSLVNGASYVFTVTAFTAAGPGVTSAPSAAVVPGGLPGKATNVAGTIGNAQVTLTWTAAPDNGVAVSKYTVLSNPVTASKSTTGASTVVFDGLANGTSYSFAVLATNAVGDGLLSDYSASLTPSTVPAAPAAPVATAAVRSATLTWTPPNDGGSAITGYAITQSVGGGADTNASSTITGTSATITGLGDGATVTFKIAAKNARGSGATSAASNAVTTTSLPAKVTGVTTTRGDGSILVGWALPASASPITKFVIDWTLTGAGGSVVVNSATSTSANVAPLTNGFGYAFTVTAYTAAGAGPASDATAPIIPSGLPGKPTAVAATRGDQSIDVIWTAPANTGGTALSSFTLTATPVGGGTPVSANVAAPASFGRVTGLTNGTAYTVAVIASNIAGAGPVSAASNSVRPAGVPTAPAITSVSGAIRQATLVWTEASPNGDAITGHVFGLSKDGGAYAVASNVTPVTATSVTITGLANGGHYAFRISATNTVGTGLPSAPSTVVNLLDVASVPQTFTATPDAAGALQAQLAWTAPASDGGSAVTGYTILVTPLTGAPPPAPFTLQAASTDTGLLVASNLVQGASYTFTITAQNAVGDSPAAAATTALANIPGAVPSITIGSRVVGGVNLSWPVAPDGGTAITSYNVYKKKSDAAGFTAATAAVNTAARTALVTGLSNGGTYQFHVSAVNNRGEGPQGGDSAPATMEDVAGAPTADRKSVV